MLEEKQHLQSGQYLPLILAMIRGEALLEVHSLLNTILSQRGRFLKQGRRFHTSVMLSIQDENSKQKFPFFASRQQRKMEMTCSIVNKEKHMDWI